MDRSPLLEVSLPPEVAASKRGPDLAAFILDEMTRPGAPNAAQFPVGSYSANEVDRAQEVLSGYQEQGLTVTPRVEIRQIPRGYEGFKINFDEVPLSMLDVELA